MYELSKIDCDLLKLFQQKYLVMVNHFGKILEKVDIQAKNLPGPLKNLAIIKITPPYQFSFKIDHGRGYSDLLLHLTSLRYIFSILDIFNEKSCCSAYFKSFCLPYNLSLICRCLLILSCHSFILICIIIVQAEKITFQI